jgi:hypothetical protein
VKMKEQQTLIRSEQVAAYRASGKSAKDWAAEQGLPLRQFVSWIGNASRWPAKQPSQQHAPRVPRRQVGVADPGCAQRFVAAQVGASVPTSAAAPQTAVANVRIELQAAPGALTLHWPLTHTRELAAWLTAFGEARP